MNTRPEVTLHLDSLTTLQSISIFGGVLGEIGLLNSVAVTIGGDTMTLG